MWTPFKRAGLLTKKKKKTRETPKKLFSLKLYGWSKIEGSTLLCVRYTPQVPSNTSKMSLINRQMLLAAQDDRDEALRRLSVGEDTQKVRDLLAGATKRIAKLEKEIAQQEAKMVSERKAAAEKSLQDKGKKAAGGGAPRKERTERPPLPDDLELSCCDCGSGFPFTGKDQVFFQKQGWSAPSRCSTCREAKKTAKPTGTELTCLDCKVVFVFSDGKARVFEEKGWEQPKRCHDCSVEHKSMTPIVIHCDGCSKDFSFSVSAQKHFKLQKWANPKRCHDCRAKKDAASVKSGSQKGASVKSGSA